MQEQLTQLRHLFYRKSKSEVSFAFLNVNKQRHLQVINLPTGGTFLNNSITSRSLSTLLRRTKFA